MPRAVNRRIQLKWVLLACVFHMLSFNGWAWGEKGHRTIAYIAWEHLHPNVQNTLNILLKAKGFTSFADAANWPDKVKSLPEFQHTKPWHYVNLAPNAVHFEPARDCPSMCVLLALNIQIERLKASNISTIKKAEALAFVIHLMGDIHQPLHVTYLKDKGGNQYPLIFNNQKINLHYYWDTAVLGRKYRAQQLAGKILQQFSQVQQASWRYSHAVDWLHESYAITRQIYAAQPKSIDGAQLAADQIIAYRRLYLAGMRIAQELNRILK